jgi:hypothetical protein
MPINTYISNHIDIGLIIELKVNLRHGPIGVWNGAISFHSPILGSRMTFQTIALSLETSALESGPMAPGFSCRLAPYSSGRIA